MKFELLIRLGNEAMQTTQDIGWVLFNVGTELTNLSYAERPLGPSDQVSVTLRDKNGNTVGAWSVTV